MTKAPMVQLKQLEQQQLPLRLGYQSRALAVDLLMQVAWVMFQDELGQDQLQLVQLDCLLA
jgi:hypothetical protein